MYYYTAYGLALQSELALPELVTSQVAPVIKVRLGKVDLNAYRVADRLCFLTLETEAGKFWIRGGTEIIIEPGAGIEEAQLRLFLLGPVLAGLLRRRGFLVLHASAVAINDGAVAFLGDTGWGKSTLSGAFHIQGYPLITDDVLAVRTDSEGAMALPGIPQAKLWPDAAAALDCPPEKLTELYIRSVKLAYRPNKGGFTQTPLPLKAIYILGGASPQHEVLACQPQDAFLHLLRHSWAKYIPNSPELDRLRFQQCTQLAKQVPIRLLKRRRSLEALPELVSLIERDLASYER